MHTLVSQTLQLTEIKCFILSCKVFSFLLCIIAIMSTFLAFTLKTKTHNYMILTDVWTLEMIEVGKTTTVA